MYCWESSTIQRVRNCSDPLGIHYLDLSKQVYRQWHFVEHNSLNVHLQVSKAVAILCITSCKYTGLLNFSKTELANYSLLSSPQSFFWSMGFKLRTMQLEEYHLNNCNIKNTDTCISPSFRYNNNLYLYIRKSLWSSLWKLEQGC